MQANNLNMSRLAQQIKELEQKLATLEEKLEKASATKSKKKSEE